MLRTIIVIMIFGVCNTIAAKSTPPELIIKRCIRKHGGWDKFSRVRDVYAKMVVRTFSKEGDIESTFKQYFRKPNKLRVEIYPGMQPPTKIGWDGKYVWQYAKGKLAKTNKPKQVERIQESLRFVRLMILTNLLEKGSVLRYEKYIAKKKIHVLSQRDSKDEKIWLYISAQNYTLLGAQFYLTAKKIPFNVIFYTHRRYGGMLLPRKTKLFRRNKLVMEAKLSLVQINSLQNGNTFFSNLQENVKIKKKRGRRRGR